MPRKIRILLLILAACALAAFAFTTIGRLDRLIPGEQLLYLSPSGHVVALPRTGGRPVESAVRPSPQVVPPGWRAVGALVRLGDTAIAFPARDGNGDHRLWIREWRGDALGAASRFIDLGAGSDFAWLGDTLLYLSAGRRQFVPASATLGPVAIGRAGLEGLAVQNLGGRRIVLGWGDHSLSLSPAAGPDSIVLSSSIQRIRAAGLWLDGTALKWAFLDEAGRLNWQGVATVDTGWASGAKLLSDSKSGSILVWVPVSGEVWRASPGTRTLLGRSIADVLTPTGAERPERILLGGTLAASTRTLGEGIRHLGALHQPGGLGIGVLRVDPLRISPSRDPLSITLGVLAPGQAKWAIWLTSEHGDRVALDSGTTLPVGLLSRRWDGRVGAAIARDGRWQVHVRAERDGDSEEDSIAFEVDGTAPQGDPIWSPGAVVSPATPRTVDLTPVVDNGDAGREVRLVVFLKSAAGTQRFEVAKSKLPANVWSFDGTTPAGDLLPEGQYQLSYALLDSISNSGDTVALDSVRIRWAGPFVQASLAPAFHAAQMAFEADLLLALDGMPSGRVTLSVKGPDGAALGDTLVVLDARGHAEARIRVNSAALDAGVHAWTIQASEGGTRTTASAIALIGTPSPRVTAPAPSQLIGRSGAAVVVRGIAPDPAPSAEGEAIYRVSLHPGRISMPTSTSWSALAAEPGVRVLPVLASKAVAGPRASFDRTEPPGSMGQASRLAQEENLAWLEPAWLTDSAMTVVLWVGKGDVVATHAITFATARAEGEEKSLGLRLIRPSSARIDRSNADPADDTLHWQIDGFEGEPASIAVLDAMGNRLNALSAPTGAFAVAGFSSTGKPLPSGSYRLIAEAIGKGRLRRIDTAFSVVAAANRPAPGLLSFEPRTIDLGSIRSGWMVEPRALVSLAEPESARVVVRSQDTTIAVLGANSQASWSTTWNGIDALGRAWLSPDSSPARGAGLLTPVRLVFSLQRHSATGWASLDSATLEIADIPSLPGSLGGLSVQGRGPDTFRVADLVSDWNLRARLDGSLLFFPPRQARWDVLPFGRQTARIFLPVDYSMEWAKYYNSLAGYQNYRGLWEWEGFYWAMTWRGPRLRHPRGYDKPEKAAVPFWMMAHPGTTGIGARETLQVVPADSFSPAQDTMRIGIPPVYRNDLDRTPFEVVRMERIFRIDPARFFGIGINTFGGQSDAFFTSNKGYSGFHSGSPVESFFNSSYETFKRTTDLSQNGYCLDAAKWKAPKIPTALLYFDSAVAFQRPRPGYSPVPRFDSFAVRSIAPEGYDPSLSERLARRLAGSDTTLLTCPMRIDPWAADGKDSIVQLPIVCTRTGDTNGVAEVFYDSVYLDTNRMFSWENWDQRWQHLLGAEGEEGEASDIYDEFWSLYLKPKKTPQDSAKYDSLRALIRSKLGVYYQSEECKPGALATVLLNMKLRGIKPRDSIPLQEYLDSLSPGSLGWTNDRNISARVELDRPRQGVIDDAHFDPLPKVWSQFFYLYGPGYKQHGADTVGKALYGIRTKNEVTWEPGQVEYHDVMTWHRGHSYDSILDGRDRVIPADTVGYHAREHAWRQRPGQSDRWYFEYTDDWGEPNYGLKFWDIFQGDDPYGDGDYWTTRYQVENLGIRNQYAYTVPLRLNWMHPWFYLHDPEVTRVHRTLYYDSLPPVIDDGLRWDAVSGGRMIDGYQTFGGYKAGQVGYWFRPSQLALGADGRPVPRVYRKNHDSIPLKEPQYLLDYAHHVHPDPRHPEQWSHHDLVFEPRLRLDDSTWGVVWDTTNVPWPNPEQGYSRPDHLDLSTLQDRERGGDSARGRTWARIERTLLPDSLWIPEPGSFGARDLDSATATVWESFPHLPDEVHTAALGSRAHRAYSFVRGNELTWSFSPLDESGNLLDRQDKIRWQVDSSNTTVTWHDGWSDSQRTVVRRNPKLRAWYAPVPDTLSSWNSAADSSLSGSDGWFHLFGRMNEATIYRPRIAVSLVPQGVDSAGSLPCYRPWTTAPFVRLHEPGVAACSDSISLNPNLLLQPDASRWDVEVYYPDGQTPNRDVVAGHGSLSGTVLRLSDARSSQRWVKLAGRVPDFHVVGSDTLPLLSWSAWGIQGAQWTSLELPLSFTDSIALTRGVRGGRSTSPWTRDSSSSAVAWWNVTGRWGQAEFRIRALFGDSASPRALWTRIPFVVGTPRDTLAQTLSDAYGRALLDVPATSDPGQKPIVLHTLAGEDLAKVPLRGAQPIGPVIQLSPSGTAFADSAPAMLSYRLTLREVLREQGTRLPDTNLSTSRDTLLEVLSWAKDELSVWLLTDAGRLERVATALFVEGDTASARAALEGVFLRLQAPVRHFSYAAILRNEPTKSLAPKWLSARASGASLAVAFDHKPLLALGGKVGAIVLRLSWAQSAEWLADSLLLPQSGLQSDTVLSAIPASWRDLLDAEQVVLHARYASSTAWSDRALSQGSDGASFGAVSVEPTRVEGACGQRIAIRFTSNRAGVAEVAIMGVGQKLSQRFMVQAGANALSWPLCESGLQPMKGIYGVLVSSIDDRGAPSADSALHFARFGIDTAPATLGELHAPDTVAVPADSASIALSAHVENWPLAVGFAAAWRPERDARGLRLSGAWRELRVERWGDSLAIVPDPADLSEGVWSVRLEGDVEGLRLVRQTSFRCVADSLRLDLQVSTELLDVDSSLVLRLAGLEASSWRLVRYAAGQTDVLASQTTSDGRQFVRELRWKADSASLGANRFCLEGRGFRGGARSACVAIRVRPALPRLGALRIRPVDTLWLGWSSSALERVAGRTARLLAEGVLDRPASLVRSFVDAAGRRRADTLALPTGAFRWEWNGEIDGRLAARGPLSVGLGVLGDTALQTDTLFVAKPARAFVWSGSADPALVSGVRRFLEAKGVSVTVGDAGSALDFLSSANRGGLILLDSILDPALWRGGNSGPLFGWASRGGDIVTVGSQVLRGWRDGDTIRDGRGDLDARMDLYGVGARPYPLVRSLAQGLSRAGAVDSIDDYVSQLWSADSGVALRDAARLRWFDSAGVSVEAGWVDRVVDTIHYTNRLGRDTTALDTVLLGSVRYFAPQPDGSRRGSLLEVPVPAATESEALASYVWAQLFVPDIGISRSDIRFAPLARGARGAKWKPIPGDTVLALITLRVRDGGLESNLDSAWVRLRDSLGLFDTALRATNLPVGRLELAPIRRVLSDSFPYGPYRVECAVDTLLWRDLEGTHPEPYLRNNLAHGEFVVGDTAKPRLWWTDSVQSGTRVRWVPATKAFALSAAGATRHHQPSWAYWWSSWVQDLKVAKDSGVLKAGSDTARFAWSMTLPEGLSHGDARLIRLGARDAFGNRDSIAMTVKVDAEPPTISDFTVDGLPVEFDSSISLAAVHLGPGTSDSARMLVTVADNPSLGRVRLVSPAGDTAVLADTLGVSTLHLARNLEILPDSLLAEDPTSAAYTLLVEDASGLDTVISFVVVRDMTPPIPWIARVRIRRADGTLDRSTRLDRTPMPSEQRLREWVRDDYGLLDSVRFDSVTLRDPSLLWLPKAPGVPVLVQVKQRDTLDLMGLASDYSGLAAIWARFDGVDVNSSAFPKQDDIIQTHRSNKLIRIVPTRSEHRLVIGARDLAGNVDSTVFILQDSLADLQVIDSALDHGRGADWGEIYMRRDDIHPSQTSDPETWDYWLVHRRNPLRSGEVDNGIYRLIIDADTNAATGDQSAPQGFRGADVAIEWGPQTRADDGTAVRFRKLVWDASSQSWVAATTRDREGMYLEEGIALDIAQADDPYTDSLGEGDQRLPTGTIARATGGAMEIGLRNGNRGSLAPIRWALLPVENALDTVRDSTGGMLTFRPKGFKPVTVDAIASDWWPDQTRPLVESHSRTEATDPRRIKLWVRNPGTVIVDVTKLSYWIHSFEKPVVVLDSAPSGLHVSLQSVEPDSTKGLDQWRVTLACGSCRLVGGSDLLPLGQLVVTGTAAATLSDDWSQSLDSAQANEHLPLYAADDHILWGSEPATRLVRDPLARITPAGPIWVRSGERYEVRADSSIDPEGQPLIAIWRQEGLGISDTGMVDTLRFERPGHWTVTLDVRDSLHPTRKGTATLEVYVEDGSGGFGGEPVREASIAIFDDRWDSTWSQQWSGASQGVNVARLVDGAQIPLIRRPMEGDTMLSIQLPNTVFGGWTRARCDASNPLVSSWCKDPELNLADYTNLEFWVAMDGGVLPAVRLSMSRLDYNVTPPGSGSRGEEPFVYLDGYLPDRSHPEIWQKVSIPLAEIYREPEVRTSGFLQLKLLQDQVDYTQAPGRRLLLDDVRLVRYSVPSGDVVSTRKNDIQVIANTVQSGPNWQIGMATRLVNTGGFAFALDSLRIRWYYRSQEGLVRPGTPDTVMGPEQPLFAAHVGLPRDPRLDSAAYQHVGQRLDWYQPVVWNANRYVEQRWNPPSAPRGLSFEPGATTTFWAGVVSTMATIGGTPSSGVGIPRFSGTHPLHWSWPDSADLWQFAPHVVVDGLRPDGTWGRLWGYAPGEDPLAVRFWNRLRLRDPSEAISPEMRIRARIRVVSGDATPGSRLTLSADSSIDPLGRALEFHWLDSLGQVRQIGPSWEFDLPWNGKFQVRLRAFDPTQPTRESLDSMRWELSRPGVALDSSAILGDPSGAWKYQEAWGADTAVGPSWVDSVDLPASDSLCPVRLRGLGGGKILRVPFGRPGLLGVRFGSPTGSLDLARFTHLEFWVASSREWREGADRERPIRIWMTHQVAPSSGENNNASEEDFGLLETYLPRGRFVRAWQKVSIPLDELIQDASNHVDRSQWFLKLMKNYAFVPADTARDADLFLSGIRLARHSPSYGRVTTRRVGAIALGSIQHSTYYHTWHGTLRVMNPTSRALLSDSLRVRFVGDRTALRQAYLYSNTGRQGTDESVSDQWFIAQPRDSAWSAPVTSEGRTVSGELQLTWAQSSALRAIRGWQAMLDLEWNQDSDTARAPWFLSRRSDIDDILFHRLVLEHRRPDGSWARLWGTLPGETFATAPFWGREPLRMPADTVAGAAAIRSLSCTDTVAVPTDSSNVRVPPGDPAQLPSLGRDPGLVTQSTVVDNMPGVRIRQTRSDWSVKHTFVFDTAWARRREVWADVYVYPAQMTAGSWVGSLSASTFDGSQWLALDPSSGADLAGAVGQWKTVRFSYDPAKYTLGRSFDFQLLANGHGGSTTTLDWVLGAIRLAGPVNGSGGGGSGGSGGGGTSPGIPMDALTAWSQCNSCQLVAEPARTAIAVAPAGGGSAMETSIATDSAFFKARAFEFDIKSQFALQGWEMMSIVLVNGASSQWWYETKVPLSPGIAAGWTRVQIPFNGALFRPGTTTTLKIILNATAPSGKRILIDNLQWIP